MKVLGSWEPVEEDSYYEKKKKAGLIGKPEDYMGSHRTQFKPADLDAYIATVKSGNE